MNLLEMWYVSNKDVPVTPSWYPEGQRWSSTEWQGLSYISSSGAILSAFELCLWQRMKTMKSKLRMLSADGAFPEAALAVNTDAEM